MYYQHLLISTLFFLISSILTFAKEVTVTLQSVARDKVTIKYRVTTRGNDMSIEFYSVKPALGLEHEAKYRDIANVRVIFFEQSGGFVNDKFVSNIETDAVMISSDEMEYHKSEEGFVCLSDFPELKLTLHRPKAQLSIPVYLAYYEKRHTYKVFASCGSLDIQLDNTQPANTRRQKGVETASDSMRVWTEIVREEMAQDAEISDSQLALMLVNKMEALLEQSSGTTLPDGFDHYANELRELEMKVTDVEIGNKIRRVLQRTEEKKAEISDRIGQKELNASREEMEATARRDLEYLKERLNNIDNLSENDVAELKATANELRRQSHAVEDKELARQMKEAADQCDEKVKKIDEAKKQRNIWMIVGGILLAILMFVGNQVFQHFRNLRNQKSLEDMQNNIARRAEDEAKRRTRNMVRGNVNQVQNAARQKGNDIVRKKGSNVARQKDNDITQPEDNDTHRLKSSDIDRNRIHIQVTNPPRGTGKKSLNV